DPASLPTELDPPSPRVAMMMPHVTSYRSFQTPQGVVNPASSSGWAQMPITSIFPRGVSLEFTPSPISRRGDPSSAAASAVVGVTTIPAASSDASSGVTLLLRVMRWLLFAAALRCGSRAAQDSQVRAYK